MCGLIVRGWFGIVRISLHQAEGHGASSLLKTVVCGVLVFFILLVMPMRVTYTTAYAYGDGGSIKVLAPYGEEFPRGASLEIRQQGLLAYRVVGEARVEGSSHIEQVPVGIYAPSLSLSRDVDVQARVQHAQITGSGKMTVPVIGQIVWEDEDDSAVASWLFRQMVLQPYLALSAVF